MICVDMLYSRFRLQIYNFWAILTRKFAKDDNRKGDSHEPPFLLLYSSCKFFVTTSLTFNRLNLSVFHKLLDAG